MGPQNLVPFVWSRQNTELSRNFGITENSDKYGNVRGIVKKTLNFFIYLDKPRIGNGNHPIPDNGKVKEFRIYLWFLYETRKHRRCYGQLLLW